MTKFHAVELKGNSDMPQDWMFDGKRFRHMFFPEGSVVLFDSENEARAAVANAPRRPDSLLSIMEWRCRTPRCECPLHG